MKTTISEELHDRILSECRGGYLGLGWGVADETGRPVAPNTPLRPCMFIGAENYYGYVVLRVNADMSLTECEKEDY